MHKLIFYVILIYYENINFFDRIDAVEREFLMFWLVDEQLDALALQFDEDFDNCAFIVFMSRFEDLWSVGWFYRPWQFVRP